MVLITSKIAVSNPLHIIHLRVGFHDLVGPFKLRIVSLCVYVSATKNLLQYIMLKVSFKKGNQVIYSNINAVIL